VIKLSSADAAWLYPGQTPESVIERLLSLGPGLILLTLGAHGAMAQSTAASTQVASPAVEVVDTVGAGDAFSAAILHRMHETEHLNAAAVPQLDGPELEDLLTFATTVAALQCTRAGASPPTLKDVEAFLGRRNDPVPAANE
jgi:fructokinase